MAKKVYIGVGHGGNDSGGVGSGYHEKDLNLAIALACHKELVRHGVTVMISRTKDENNSLAEYIRECNKFAPDYAVDIHNNIGKGDGAEAYHHVGGGKGKVLAENILDAIEAIGQNSRGAKTRKNALGLDYYGFIRLTDAPAVIVECAFMDNWTDMEILNSAAEQKAMGIAIAKGILKTLGIAYVPENAQNGAGAANNSGVSVSLPVIDRGAKGAVVKAAQAMLKGYGYSLGSWGVDGDFGAATESAVKKFQEKNGLTADGIVGKATWHKLLGL